MDAQGRVSRYNLAYINHRIYAGDNGRVLGYDSAHGYHHRQLYGRVTPIRFKSYEEIERRFQNEWNRILKEARHAKTELRVESADSFFNRGRVLAKSADRGDRIASSRVVAFERVEDLLGF